MNLILRWSSHLFVIAAGTLLLLVRQASDEPHFPSSAFWVLLWVTLATLPAAIIQVYKDDDPKSRRNWLLMLGVFAVLLVAALLMKPVR